MVLSEFASLLDFIEEHFKVIPLADAVRSLRSGRLRGGCACITFDDGYADWVGGVVPMLKQRDMHATFFITTGQFSGTPMWHERVATAVKLCPSSELVFKGSGLPALPLESNSQRTVAIQRIERVLKYLPLDERDELLSSLELSCKVTASDTACMPPQDVRSIHSQGFDIGAHTNLHPILSLCHSKDALAEIGTVRERLAGIIGGSVRSFAYPNGRPQIDFNGEHVKLVEAAGYEYAVTTGGGGADVSTPIYQIPRFTPWGPTHFHRSYQLARNLLQEPRLVREKPARGATRRRVLFVENGAGFGGAVVALAGLLRHWRCDGFEPHVVSNWASGSLQQAQNVAGYRVISDRRHDLRPLARRIQGLPLGPLKSIVLFLVGRADDLANQLPYLLSLLLHIRKIRPDVIHGNNGPGSNRVALLVAWLLKIPYVQHLRGPLGPRVSSDWPMARPAIFIPVSRWLADSLHLAGIGAERIRQIYDGIDPPPPGRSPVDGSLRDQLGLQEDAILVAMVGMLVPWKGQGLFIDALSGIDAQGHRPVHFLLIGGTPEFGDRDYAQGLRARAQASSQSQRIHFIGLREDLRDFMPELDIVVSASTEPEPLGLVMLEALASECTFIAPAFGAALEVINEPENGFLFEPRSATSLREKIQSALQQMETPMATQRAPRFGAQERFSGGRCADTTLMIYRSLV
jgi:glycosyltransferase involved in cell wall biosynthesis/peptidoglycan/xylan/chitin deacetylase (PgdA/CDA1 family)